MNLYQHNYIMQRLLAKRQANLNLANFQLTD